MATSKSKKYLDTGIVAGRSAQVIDSTESAGLLGHSLPRFYNLPKDQLPTPIRPGKYYLHDILWVREYLRWTGAGCDEEEARQRANLAAGVGQSEPDQSPNKNNKKQQGSPNLRQRAQAWEGGAK